MNGYRVGTREYEGVALLDDNKHSEPLFSVDEFIELLEFPGAESRNTIRCNITVPAVHFPQSSALLHSSSSK